MVDDSKTPSVESPAAPPQWEVVRAFPGLWQSYGAGKGLESSITPSEKFNGRPQAFIYTNGETTPHFIIDPEDPRMQECIRKAHDLAKEYPLGCMPAADREKIISKTLAIWMTAEFGPYNWEVVEAARIDKEKSALEEQRNALFKKAFDTEDYTTLSEPINALKKTIQGLQEQRDKLTEAKAMEEEWKNPQPTELRHMKSGTLICRQQAYILGTLLAEADVPNVVVGGQVMAESDKEVGSHVFVVSKETRAVFESTVGFSEWNNIYRPALNNLSLDEVEKGETLVVHAPDDTLLAYGTGDDGTTPAMKALKTRVLDHELISRLRQSGLAGNIPIPVDFETTYKKVGDFDTALLHAYRKTLPNMREVRNDEPMHAPATPLNAVQGSPEIAGAKK